MQEKVELELMDWKNVENTTREEIRKAKLSLIISELILDRTMKEIKFLESKKDG